MDNEENLLQAWLKEATGIQYEILKLQDFLDALTSFDFSVIYDQLLPYMAITIYHSNTVGTRITLLSGNSSYTIGRYKNEWYINHEKVLL